MKTTFTGILGATLGDEGLYLCSSSNRLHHRPITEAYMLATAPIYTYVYVYNSQRPALTVDLVKEITQVYIRFLVESLFEFLNRQNEGCKPIVEEVREMHRLIVEEFSTHLHNLRRRNRNWFDFLQSCLEIFGVLCILSIMYLWRSAEETLAYKVRELERVARL